MTKAYVSQYANQALDRHGQPIAAGEQPELGTTQLIDYTAGEAHGANLDPKCRLIRVHVDSIAAVRIALNAVAVVTDARFAAGQTEYFGLSQEAVTAGIRVSAITTT
jgi:hypothetical protein